MRNRQWLINAHPRGRGLVDDDFKWIETQPRDPGPGEVLVAVKYLGFDPAQKGWMENIANYVAPTTIGEVMRGSGIGQILKSNADGISEGDMVMGLLGWQDYATVAARDLTRIENDDLLTANLGALGTTGMTAYFGLLRHGRPKPGDTVIVSGAAGATGSMVGQIAKIGGCRVIGIAGGPDKCAWIVNECGFDAAIDYKNEKVRSRIRELAPEGVNVIYDNVGGAILNDMLACMALHARVVICGGISRYETGTLPAGPEHYFNLVFQRGTMEGFIVLDYAHEFADARKRMKRWVREGRIKFAEDIQSGLENAPRTLMRLFSGQNFGKQMLKVS